MTEFVRPEIENQSTDVHKLTFLDGKELFIIGTAHVSAESVKMVEEIIRRENPDTIAVELDAQRLEVIQNRKQYENTDVIQIIKSKKALFFAAQLVMTAYQKKIAKKLGVKPGAEFKMALDLAEELKAKIILVDRDIKFTLKRLIRKLNFIDKFKIFAGFMIADEEDKDIDEDKIAELKKGDTLTALIGEMGESMPKVKQVILDERDLYMTGKLQHNLGQKTVAVVGAAHVPGMLKFFEREIREDELKEIEIIPPRSKLSIILPWLLPLVIIFFFVYGFLAGNHEVAGQAIIYWILINGILTAIGCVLALGHPLTIPAGFIAAPITSLNPMIGAGMVTGLVQILLVRPNVKDIEKVTEDATTFRGWWRNRLTRVLLVTILSSIGSAIGTFVAFPLIIKMFLS